MSKEMRQHIDKFNKFRLTESENLNISDVSDSEKDWLMPWKVIDLREVCKKIANGDFDKHPVYQEWRYQVLERSKGNDRGNLEWVGNNEKTPLINNFLLENGFEKDEMIIYYVTW